MVDSEDSTHPTSLMAPSFSGGIIHLGEKTISREIVKSVRKSGFPKITIVRLVATKPTYPFLAKTPLENFL